MDANRTSHNSMSRQHEHRFIRNGRPARLLLLMPELGARRGGGICQVGRSVMRLFQQRRREGMLDCRVLALGRPDDDAECDEFRREWGGRLKWFDKRRFGFSAAALAAMASWADAVITMHVGLAAPLLLLPRFLRPASITFIHGIEVWRPLRLRHRLSLRRSDCVVANSRFTARTAAKFNPWLSDVHCCHLGAACETIEIAGNHADFARCSPSRWDILTVGRMAQGEGRKGHRELIGAMEHVVAKLPDARLLIAGTGDDIQTYVDLARRSPACDRIIFLGYVPDEMLRALYRRVGAFAMPSRQEGFGLVYLEAMAAGLPCLASTCDAASEVVVDGETGLLVDPSDQVALVAALVRLLGNHELREKLGCQGRKRFEECFTEERFHERMWELVERALQAGSKDQGAGSREETDVATG
jgi:phosphatidylinositol alpha-1,6-mannosyltransferase